MLEKGMMHRFERISINEHAQTSIIYKERSEVEIESNLNFDSCE